MDMKRIRYALALAQELNFARAAEKVHVSQPALSRGIQTLEEEMGLQLFDRDNRNVSITKVGAVFLEHAKRVFYQMRTLELDMAQIRDVDIGHVTFGVGQAPTYGLLSQVLREIRQQRPGIRFTVDTNNWGYLLLHLRAEEIEFFVADIQDIGHEPDLAITPLCRQRGAFICRPEHPLVKKADRQVKDMLPYGFAFFSVPDAILVRLRRMFGLTSGQPLPVVLQCDNLTVLKDLVIHGDLIMAATLAAVDSELRAGTVVSLSFPKIPSLFTEIGIVHLHGRTLSPGAKMVLNTIRAVAAKAPGTSMHKESGFDEDW
jgi:DNA-binding transcriptional LysR family regulator